MGSNPTSSAPFALLTNRVSAVASLPVVNLAGFEFCPSTPAPFALLTNRVCAVASLGELWGVSSASWMPVVWWTHQREIRKCRLTWFRIDTRVQLLLAPQWNSPESESTSK